MSVLTIKEFRQVNRAMKAFLTMTPEQRQAIARQVLAARQAEESKAAARTTVSTSNQGEVRDA